MDDPSRAPNVVPPDPPIAPRIARIVLLVATLLLLFPQVLNRVTHWRWLELVIRLGTWRWVIWAACFIAMTLLGLSSRRGRR